MGDTLAITGHRPESISDPRWVRGQLTETLKQLSPSLLYQGMAEGVDLISAEIARELEIPYIAVRPWAGHGVSAAWAQRYQEALDGAREVIVLSDSERYLGPWQFHQRNQYMVEHAQLLLAVWDGKPKGGTAATVRYAKSQDVPYVWLNPDAKTVEFMYDRPEEQLPTLF